MNTEAINQSSTLNAQTSDIRIANFIDDPIQIDSNKNTLDKRIFETSLKTNENKRKRTKLDWRMNIVKDIVKSNLVLTQNGPNISKKSLESKKASESVKVCQIENTNTIKNKHSITITVNNDQVETPTKRVKTSLKDSRLVINKTEELRIIIHNEKETKNDVQIIESKETASPILETVNLSNENDVIIIEDEEENASEKIDDWFKKTTSKPEIYWAPVASYRVKKWYNHSMTKNEKP